MRTVVTGGAGFIGSHLIEALVGRGDEVVCVERPGASNRWIEGLPVRRVDCGLDRVEALAPVVRDCQVVYHLAALTEARSAAECFAVNTLGTEHVLRAAAAAPRAPRVVFMSSLAALGPCRDGEALSPDSAPRPLSEYGRSKLLAEQVVHAYADRVPSVILRFPTVYGPRERAVLKLFQMVQRGLAVTVGSWDRPVSLIYMADTVGALIAAGTEPRAPGRTCCVAHPEPVTWAAFVRAVAESLGRRPLCVRIPVPAAQAVAVAAEAYSAVRRRAAILNRGRVRELAQSAWVCDPSRAIVELGFHPRVALATGVAETARWYREADWL